MELSTSDLVFYYPGYHWVYSWRGQISFCFTTEKRIEIYRKKDFQLLFQSCKENMYNLLSRYPSLAGVKLDENAIHVFNSGKVNRSQYLSCFENYGALTYKYSIGNENLHIDQNLLNREYLPEEKQDYNALFQGLDFKLFENADTLNRLFSDKNNVLYSNAKIEIENFSVGGEAVKGWYKNIMIKELYLEGKDEKRKRLKRILAIDVLKGKINWYIDIENDIKKNHYEFLVKHETYKENRIPKEVLESFYLRTYGDVPFLFNEVYVYRHNQTLYALDVLKGEVRWKKENTFDFPLVFEKFGYILNLMGAFKIIDLNTGEIVHQNENWIEDKSKWFQIASTHSNLNHQNNHIKIYAEYIVAYNYYNGVFYFFSRTTGALINEVDIKDVFWNFAIKKRKVKRSEIKRVEEDRLEEGDLFYYSTYFWEIYNGKLFIQLPHVFCVFDLNAGVRNSMLCRIGSSNEKNIRKNKKKPDTNKNMNSGRQLRMDL